MSASPRLGRLLQTTVGRQNTPSDTQSRPRSSASDLDHRIVPVACPRPPCPISFQTPQNAGPWVIPQSLPYSSQTSSHRAVPPQAVTRSTFPATPVRAPSSHPRLSLAPPPPEAGARSLFAAVALSPPRVSPLDGSILRSRGPPANRRPRLRQRIPSCSSLHGRPAVSRFYETGETKMESQPFVYEHGRTSTDLSIGSIATYRPYWSLFLWYNSFQFQRMVALFFIHKLEIAFTPYHTGAACEIRWDCNWAARFQYLF